MQKTAFVTGANQGLGLALVEGLCRMLGSDATVYLTARSAERGAEAVSRLTAMGLRPAFHILDVTNDESVQAFAHFLQTKHGGVDIVISNAAARIVKGAPQSEQVRAFVNTNNHGTYRILKNFAPLLKDGARLLVVASAFGSLRNLARVHHDRFDVSRRSLIEIEETMDEYVAAVEQGRDKEQEWPDWINVPSKVAQVASMKILARDLREEARRRGILINAVCPGLVDTEASRPWFENMSSAQSPQKAAEDLLWLATAPESTQDPYGELVQHRKVLPWA